MIDYLHGVELTPLRKLLFMGALAGGKEVEDTASGNPLTFVTDLARPLKSLVANFLPVQAGTGDPSPENVRSISGWSALNVWHMGANLLRLSDATKVFCSVPSLTTITYASDNSATIKSTYSFGNHVVWELFKITDGMVGQKVNIINSTNCNLTISADEWETFGTVISGVYQYTITASDVGKRMGFKMYTYGQQELSVENAIVNFGDSLADFSPYSGESYPITFPALGKNLFDVNAPEVAPSSTATFNTTKRVWKPYTRYDGIAFSNYFIKSNVSSSVSDGTITVTNTNVYGLGYAIPVKPGDTYHLTATGSTDARVHVAYYEEDGTFVSGSSSSLLGQTFSVPPGADMMVLIFIDAHDGTATFSNVMLNTGSTAEPYEPFTNTIYGGSLDLVTGVLTAEWASVTLDGSVSPSVVNWKPHDGKSAWLYSSTAIPSSKTQGVYCDKVRTASYGNLYNTDDIGISNAVIGNEYGLAIRVGVSGLTTEETINAWLAENPLQVVYLLKTPQTYQLTPQQITALIGDNTIWSDANGTCEVTYLKKG